MKGYTKEEVLKSSLEYFDGDELAATTWMNKYCLKDDEGNLLELNPDMMHERLASEFSRIENKYKNPLTKDEIYNLLKDFKYVIPQGSPMSGIGNDYKISSLSNCFVIGNPGSNDSIGGIMKLDEELAQISKRRGGVGIDLSFLRPEGASVTNDAVSSSGVVSFAERYSNTTREIGQGGRRGALMLSLSIKHPDAEKFINAKLDLNKITGANISVRLTDEFMNAVKANETYLQTFPCDANLKINKDELVLNKLYKKDKIYYRLVEASKLWNLIITNAHKSAEPGVLFWDNILRESPADCYKEFGYETKGTNPCFTGDTLVNRMIPGGDEYELVPISEIEFGDKVLSYNTKKGKLEYKKVKFSTLTRCNADIISVKIRTSSGEYTIKCTEDHPFYNVETGRYNPPKVGMKLQYSTTKQSSAFLRSKCDDGEIIEISSAGKADVYDIGVFGNHNFYVGDCQVLVHNCSELPLSPYDSCRLISINLYSYVKDPFTNKAKFDFELFEDHVIKAQRLMDDLVDLEIEKIHKIIDKVNSDPEIEDIKSTELKLWNKILKATSTARRTGLGATAVGDCIAALGLTYGSDESIKVIESIFKMFAISSYESSIIMADERGAFSVFNKKLEEKNPFINRIIKYSKNDIMGMYYTTGRRNIANLTLAPTGTTSLMTQTTSGIEPVFMISYTRRRKINSNNQTNSQFKDNNGDEFEEFTVWHPKFIEYLKVKLRECKESDLTDMNLKEIKWGLDTLSNAEIANHLEAVDKETLNKLVVESPYYKSTAQDINWVSKVKLQGTVQKWIDHAISATTNVPKDTTISTVSDIYKAAYEYGCKGETIYRDGSRDGVLVSNESTITNSYKRSEYLDCKIVRFKNGNENWIAFVGVLNDKPIELFTGKIDDDLKFLPKSIESGVIKQVRNSMDDNKSHRYDFIYDIKFGYKNTLPDIGSCFDSEYWNYAIMVSEMLRSNIKLDKIINILENLSTKENTMNVWNRGVARALRKFVKDGTESESSCPECGAKMVYENGCKHCNNCGYNACN